MRRNKLCYKTAYILVLLLVSVTFLNSCGKKDKEDSTALSVTGIINENSMVTIYEVGDDRIQERSERYQLKQPESIPAAVEEIMTEFTVPEVMQYVGYTVDENSNVIITIQDVSSNEESRLMIKAALVKTLVQIHNINKVVIDVLDEGGTSVDKATYTDASFIYM